MREMGVDSLSGEWGKYGDRYILTIRPTRESRKNGYQIGKSAVENEPDFTEGS